MMLRAHTAEKFAEFLSHKLSALSDDEEPLSWKKFREIQREADHVLDHPEDIPEHDKQFLVGICYVITIVIHKIFGDLGTDTPYDNALDAPRIEVRKALITFLEKIKKAILASDPNGEEKRERLAFKALSAYFLIYNEKIVYINKNDHQKVASVKGGEV